MGCGNSKNPKAKLIVLAPEEISRYPRHYKLEVKGPNSKTRPLTSNSLSFQLTEPQLIHSKFIQGLSKKLSLSACVLPGLDPRNECRKDCQDNLIFLHHDAAILLALFDGHGADGSKIAHFCCKFTEKYYDEHPPSSQDSPETYLTKLFEECDSHLTLSNLEVLYSGSTGVAVLILDEKVYSASVGDSRAILATTEMPALLPMISNKNNIDKKVLMDLKITRESVINPKVKAVELTLDQKPEDPEETYRIVSHGGRIQRLVDENNKRIGPFRVWESASNAPGLTVSRSLGDVIGKRVGIIATPLCSLHTINEENDLFIVLASDGVWDVMDNEDVVNFTESFRHKCKIGNLKQGGKSSDVVPAVTCIAHLLSEEARMRWFSIVENEDVMIDDISCIVLEFKKSENVVSAVVKKMVYIGEDVADNEVQHSLMRAPSLKDVNTRDPRRGSYVTDKILL